MTTSSNPTPATPESEDSSSELSRIWRAIGVLQGTVATLVEGQRQLMEGQRQLMENQERMKQELRAEFKAEQQELRAEFKAEQQELRSEFKAGQQEQRSEFKSDLREVHRRLDRMFYTFVGIGGALIVSVYASRFIGG